MSIPIIHENHDTEQHSTSVKSFRERVRERMEKAGYRFVGAHKHSAIKICEWCRNSLRGKGYCYKQKFYGISSHRCVQMSPVVFSCSENCLFCWRPLRFSLPAENEQWDAPKDIVDGCIQEQVKILQGFGGNDRTTKKKMHEAARPKHFAISLSGEPTLYPYIGELIEEIKSRKMTAFLVTNGTLPERVQSLIDNDQQPTQMYVTLAAPNPEVFQRTALPIFHDAWERLQKTLSLLNQFDRTVIRLTLVKGLNLTDPKGYAEIVDKASPHYLEIKAFMSVGGARDRLPYSNMPSAEEMMSFAEEIEKHSSYKIVDNKKDSRVVLLTRDGKPNDLIEFD